MKPAFTALIGAAALAAGAHAQPAPPPSKPPTESCLRTSDIDSHRVADDHTLYIRQRNRDVFRLEMSGACLSGAGPSDPLVIRATSGVPLACRPVDLDISIAHNIGMGGGGRTPCIVRSMSRLTPAEVAALPPKYRP